MLSSTSVHYFVGKLDTSNPYENWKVGSKSYGMNKYTGSKIFFSIHVSQATLEL